MIKAECDRCGKQKETDGQEKARISVMLPPPFAAIQPRLPEGWRRVVIPAEDEAVQGERKELCAECVNALRQFFEGDGAVPGLLEPETLAAVEAAAAQCDGCTHAPHAAGACSVVWMGDRCECDEPVGVDPRPNLTARAEKIATGGNGVRSERCTCAGVGFGTEDCVPHHPDGLEKGTHLKCQQDDGAGECPGIYRRGMFPEHMERWHGIKVAEGSKACPYCPEIKKYITELGPHIAKDHPGDWQAWIDGGQKPG